MKKNILILGSDGMLGSMMLHYFQKHHQATYNVFYTSRNASVGTENPNKIAFGVNSNNIQADITSVLVAAKFDYVINCIGIIKPNMATSLTNAIMVNSIFPHLLSQQCNILGYKLIHITTDCVFSGSRGLYDESDHHDATDEYGKTKSLGEPTDCLVLRTSIIGPEINHKVSLIETVKKNAGKTMMGFCHHEWNGVTTLELAKICDKIMTRNMWVREKRHVFSPMDVNKFELLKMISDRYNLKIKLTPYRDDRSSINRTLRTCYSRCFNDEFDIPDLNTQIYELPY